MREIRVQPSSGAEVSTTNTRKRKKELKDVNEPTDARHIWTPEELEKFKIAYAKYGNELQSNKKIASFIGNGIYPKVQTVH